MLLTSELDPWLAVFGRFHIVLLHLPIGLLPGMALLEFGAALIRKPNPRGAVLTLSVMTALVAAAALASGLVLAGEKTDTELLGQHKVWAIAMTVVCALLPCVAALRNRAPFRVAVAVAIALSIWTGHLGGSLTHKQGFLFKPLERAARADAPPKPTTDPTPPQATTAVSYEKDIAPIFQRVCTDCHNAEDYEGDLDLTSKEGILCLDREAEDRLLITGRPDDSHLLTVCEFPLDDEDHMPPEDEPQMTSKEVATLRRWIQEGCKFD